MYNYCDWSRKQFDELRSRDWNQDIGEFNSLVILPLRSKHDSGHRIMDFAAIKDGEPLCKLSGCSDVIHIQGIGGYGFGWPAKGSGIPESVEPLGWSIDCLPKSGLLQLFCSSHYLRAGTALSSFEIYATRKYKE